MINELVKTNKEWLPGGMVDAVDSKSTDRKVVRVRVSGEPPTLYRLKIFNLDGTQDESAKTFIGRYLNIKNKGEYWSQSIFKDGYRNNKNFIQADVVALDFDDEYNLIQAIQEFKEHEHIIVPTRNHLKSKGSHPAVDRFRVVLRLSRTVTDTSEYKTVMKSLLSKYPQADQSPKDPGRLWAAGGHSMYLMIKKLSK